MRGVKEMFSFSFFSEKLLWPIIAKLFCVHPCYWKVIQNWERINYFSITFPFFPPVHCIITRLFFTFSLFFFPLLAISLTVSTYSVVISNMWPWRVKAYVLWGISIMFLSEDWRSVGVCLVFLPPLESMQVAILQVFKSKLLRSGI